LQSDKKKRNRGALKGKGGGEKTIDRTEKHRPQPKKQTKILNKNVTRDITKSSQIPPDRRTVTLTPMLSSSPKCEEEKFGDRNDQGEKAVNRKKREKQKKTENLFVRSRRIGFPICKSIGKRRRKEEQLEEATKNQE
jgi:hypothetical protein